MKYLKNIGKYFLMLGQVFRKPQKWMMFRENLFKEIDLEKIKTIMKTPNLIDCRNVYNPVEIKKLGFNYISIGRP